MLFDVVFVSRDCDLPSLSVRYSSTLPSRLLWNTTCVSSGERDGRESIAALLDRLIGWFSPSVPSSRKICRLPSRNEWNTIQFGHEGPGFGACLISMSGGGGGGGGSLDDELLELEELLDDDEELEDELLELDDDELLEDELLELEGGGQRGSTSPCAALQFACRLPLTGLPLPWSP